MGLNKTDCWRYCELIREGKLRTQAAAELEIPYHEITRRRKSDEAFALEEQTAVEIAEETRRDLARTELWRRAVEGVLEPVFYRGEQVALVRKYSDMLLRAELVRLDPRYNERYLAPPELPALAAGQAQMRANLVDALALLKEVGALDGSTLGALMDGRGDGRSRAPVPAARALPPAPAES